MKTTRPILGFISYKWSTITIMKELNWPTIHQLVMAESLKLIHKIIFEGIPKSINSHFIYSDRCESVRMVRKLRMKDLASDDKLKQSVYYRTIFLYNKISYQMRTSNPKKFSKLVLGYLQENFSPHSIPKND